MNQPSPYSKSLKILSVVGDVGASFCCTQCVNCQVGEQSLLELFFNFLQFFLVGTSSFLFFTDLELTNISLDRGGDRCKAGRSTGSHWKINQLLFSVLSLSPSFRLENESVSMSLLCPGLCLCG